MPPNAPAVVWPDGSGSWYWEGIAVPEQIAAARDQLTADLVARIDNQELRRVTLERMGWERFLATASAELRAQDDYGKLWATNVRLDGERVHLVEVVNATAEPDGSHRRYFLRVPPTARTAREAVGWTFGFENADDYILAVYIQLEWYINEVGGNELRWCVDRSGGWVCEEVVGVVFREPVYRWEGRGG